MSKVPKSSQNTSSLMLKIRIGQPMGIEASDDTISEYRPGSPGRQDCRREVCSGRVVGH
jgi:hypothetical protein